MIQRIVRAVLNRVPAHAADRVGERLLPMRAFERLSVPSESALTITCDDGELRDLDIVDVLERFGARGVFAVSPDLIGKPGFLTYEQLRHIRAAGHEIAFHGTTHDAFTRYRETAELVHTCRRGIDGLQAEGLGRPTTLIYPYGMNDRAVRESMSSLFECAFTTWFGINRARTNRYAIRRIAFGAYTGKQPATEQWYRSALERARGEACWPTLMLHPAAKGHTDEHTAMLSRLLLHARDIGLPVRTASAHLAASAGRATAAVVARDSTSS